ncbi:hypothetical protein LAZ67_3005794 [Cordylochernes scorpioides]|uniref:Uncharacterized protein n=1 Tax=Cordylochernes scorpioides TaxID=51811 RepID=A0ABY6KAR0_9ARAC|nr:hypothetical protein LAZ67_3005794 [Cordylochernes scorpioides]
MVYHLVFMSGRPARSSSRLAIWINNVYIVLPLSTMVSGLECAVLQGRSEFLIYLNPQNLSELCSMGLLLTRLSSCNVSVTITMPSKLHLLGEVVVLCCQVTCQRLRSKARSIIELALFCHHSTLIAANYSQHCFRFSSSEIVVQRLPPAIETFPSLSPHC